MTNKLDPERDLHTLTRARKLGVRLTELQREYESELTERRRRERIRSAAMEQLCAAVERAEIAARKPKKLLLPRVRPSGEEGHYILALEEFVIASEPGVELRALAPFCFIADDQPDELLESYMARNPGAVMLVDADAFEADPVRAIRDEVRDKDEAVERMQAILSGQSGDVHVQLPRQMLELWLNSEKIDESLKWELARLAEAYDSDSRESWSFRVLHSWPRRGEKPRALFNEADLSAMSRKRATENEREMYNALDPAPIVATAESETAGGAE